MMTIPYFVHFDLVDDTDRESAMALLEAAAEGTGRTIHPVDGDQEMRNSWDLVVTDASSQVYGVSTRPVLSTQGPRMTLSDGMNGVAPIDGPEDLRQKLGLSDDAVAEISSLWSFLATKKLPWFVLRQWYPLLLWATVGRRLRRHEVRPSTRKFDSLSATADPSRAQIALLMAKADAVADLYGQKYRSAYVGRFILSAVVAVFVAFMLFVLPQARLIAYSVEFVASLLIIVSFTASGKGDWKGKWLSGRFVGESLRNALAMGHESSGFLLQNRDHPDDPVTPEERLVDWCTRQIILAENLQTKDARAAAFSALLEDQIAYHTDRLKTLTLIEQRLSKIGLGSFVLSMLLALFAVLATTLAPDMLTAIQSPVALTLGILPAIGAALFAIRVQANFNAEALHSNTVIVRLDSILLRLPDAPEPVLTALRARFVKMQLAEFSDWRQVQLGRALDLP